MVGRRPKVDHIRDGFLRSLSSAGSLYTAVQKVGAINPATEGPRLHTEHVRRVIELAFLGIVAAWEEFLELTIVRYLAGAKCDNGYAPILRVGEAHDLEHAYQLITGDPDFDPSKRYVGLSEPKSTVSIAKLFFDTGRPYSDSLNARADRLEDAIRLRNRVAHSSEKCRSDFKRTARSFLGLGEKANLRRSFRVGDLLSSTAERQFGQSAKHRGLSIFEAYVEMFEDLAIRIVPK